MSRRTIPSWFKRMVLPFWNGGHQVAWFLGEHADAIRRRRFEHCDVCGRFGPMLVRRRVVPSRLIDLWGLSTQEAEALVRKESSDCFACGAKLRCRRMARVLLGLFDDGPGAPSLRVWARGERARTLRIAEINRIDGVHEALEGLPGWVASEYIEGARSGTIVAGVRSEDLTRLSYDDASFDLLLSSETLEHVPELDRALAEVRRVLVPGGVHVFTAPVRPDLERGFTRAVRHPSGRIEHLATPIHHPGGDVGYPVFHEFGLDFADRVRAAGFAVEVHHGPVRLDDLAQVYVARRPPD